MLLFSWWEYSRLYLLIAVSKKISWEEYMVQLDQNLTLKSQENWFEFWHGEIFQFQKHFVQKNTKNAYFVTFTE